MNVEKSKGNPSVIQLQEDLIRLILKKSGAVTQEISLPILGDCLLTVDIPSLHLGRDRIELPLELRAKEGRFRRDMTIRLQSFAVRDNRAFASLSLRGGAVIYLFSGLLQMLVRFVLPMVLKKILDPAPQIRFQGLSTVELDLSTMIPTLDGQSFSLDSLEIDGGIRIELSLLSPRTEVLS